MGLVGFGHRTRPVKVPSRGKDRTGATVTLRYLRRLLPGQFAVKRFFVEGLGTLVCLVAVAFDTLASGTVVARSPSTGLSGDGVEFIESEPPGFFGP